MKPNSIKVSLEEFRDVCKKLSKLSEALNNDIREFLCKIFPDKASHHIDYLISKLSMSRFPRYFGEKMTGLGCLVQSLIPFEDMFRITKWVKVIPTSTVKNVVQCSVIFMNHMNIFILCELYGIDFRDNEEEFREKTWNPIMKISLDEYFLSLPDSILEKIITWCNNLYRTEYLTDITYID